MLTAHHRGLTLLALNKLLSADRITLSPPLAALMLADVLRSLHDLRQEGLVYLGARPSALHLCVQSRVLFRDLSLARMSQASKDKLSITKNTAPYFAPEMIAGEPPGPRADIYATGVTLYEQLVGRPVYGDLPVEQVLEKVVQSGPNLDRLRIAKAPAGLIQIVARAVAIVPEHRFNSALEMAQALETWLASGPGTSMYTLGALVRQYTPRGNA